jgi:hypothetical protein
MLVDVDRVHFRFDDQLELIVGALVADEYGDSVRVGCPQKRDADAPVHAAREHDTRIGLDR